MGSSMEMRGKERRTGVGKKNCGNRREGNKGKVNGGREIKELVVGVVESVYCESSE